MTQAKAERLEAAKQAVAVKDWNSARTILAPLVAEDPYGVPAFFLARAEFELGRPEVAAPLVTAFRAHRPRHVGSAVLAARIRLATGDLEQAESLAESRWTWSPTTGSLPDSSSASLRQRSPRTLLRPIAAIDAHHHKARAGILGPALFQAAERLRGVEPGPDWVRDTAQAKIAYFHHARDIGEALRNYDPRPDRCRYAVRLPVVAETDPAVPRRVGARCRLRVRGTRDRLPGCRCVVVHRRRPRSGARQHAGEEQASPAVG